MNVLFDLDGTLTNPREGIVACIKHALETLGRPVPTDFALERFIGPPLRDSFRELLANDGVQIEQAVDAYRDRFAARGMFENVVYEGIPGVLQLFAERGVQLYVVTSKPRVFAERILDHFALAKYFVAIYGSELDGRLSDKGELIAHLLATSSINRTDTVMVGDRHYDVRGALRNGVVPVGVLWGYGSRQELSTAGAERLFEEPRDLVQLVA